MKEAQSGHSLTLKGLEPPTSLMQLRSWRMSAFENRYLLTIVVIARRHLTQLGFAAHDGPGRPGACQADGFSLDNCSIEQWQPPVVGQTPRTRSILVGSPLVRNLDSASMAWPATHIDWYIFYPSIVAFLRGLLHIVAQQHPPRLGRNLGSETAHPGGFFVL